MKIDKLTGGKRIISVPSDKSISHRAIMCGALATGTSKAYNLLMSEDVLSTIGIMRKLGVKIQLDNNNVTIHGVGMQGLKPTSDILWAGNSGTTARIVSGILAGANGKFCLDGDKYLRVRPMNRVTAPLELMGAKFDNQYLPMNICGGKLNAIDFKMQVKSAQVKSAIIFAGLNANGQTRIFEETATRNHSEVMLKNLSANITSDGHTILVDQTEKLDNFVAQVPADISSASFFMVLGLILENSEILIKNVGINRTRCGIIEIIKRMGGDIEVLNVVEDIEPTADILVRYSPNMKGIDICGEIIPNIIDEIPIICVLASFCEGETVISDARELRVKESDRIKAMVTNLKSMGVDIEEKEDGMIIKKSKIHSAKVDSYGDHRIAMSCAVGLSTVGGEITNADCVNISFPNFYELLGGKI